MKILIEDKWLGKRELTFGLEVIEDQLKLLNKFRRDGRKPSRSLLDDIAVYKYIIKSDDPDGNAKMYLRLMSKLKKEGAKKATKKEVAITLGWRIFK